MLLSKINHEMLCLQKYITKYYANKNKSRNVMLTKINDTPTYKDLQSS